MVGLGTGALASYARAGDYVRFYEIDPTVARIATSQFSFLGDAHERGADVDHWLGDARRVMERQLAEGPRSASTSSQSTPSAETQFPPIC